MSAFYLKDPNDEAWAADPGVLGYREWMKAEFPEGNPADLSNVYGYSTAQTLVQVQPNWALFDYHADFTAKNDGDAVSAPVIRFPFDPDAERAKQGLTGKYDPASLRVQGGDAVLPAQVVSNAKL